MSNGKASTENSELQEKRLEALRRTWHYARSHSPYYERTLPKLDAADITFERLNELPTTDRELVEANRNEMRCRRGLPSYMVFTGGSTGLPLVVYGDKADLAERQRKQAGTSGRARLSLTTDGGHHGYVPQVPGDLGYIQVPLRNRKNYQWAWHVLTADHRFEGFETKVTSAVLPLPAAKKLVYFALENRLDARQLKLRRLTTFAWHLSRRWCALIEKVLLTQVYDSYGFTEIPGALAHECCHCGWYHFGPQVVWEAVDPHTNLPTSENIGKLLVTSLTPYINDLILFRYEPKDLIEVGPYCEHAHDRGLKPVGRIGKAIALRRGQRDEWIFLPSRMQELVDRDPLIGRLADVRFSGITATEDDSFPKWCAQLIQADRVPTLEVRVELKTEPNLFFDTWQAYQLDLRARLRESHPALKQLMNSGEVALRIVGLPPGAIANEDVCVC